eukprot:gene3472-4361_t
MSAEPSRADVYWGPLVASTSAVTRVTAEIPMDPQEVLVNVGDTVTLSWSGTHSVSSILNEADYADCVFSSEGSVLVADTSVNEYSQTFSAAGSFYFACDVSSHCSAGQKLTVT